MKQIVTNQSHGQILVADVPEPALRDGGVLVRTAYSLVSAGTERAKVELAQKSLVGKARARPDQFRQVLNGVCDQGLLSTYYKVRNRLDALEPLGYSLAGIVIAVGAGVEGLEVGNEVACAGAGYANHAEVVFVPQNLCAKLPTLGSGRVSTSLTLDRAAFATLGAIALHGVRQADVRLGEDVAVLGLGLLGLLAVQILKSSGCRTFGFDPSAARCQLAESLGCDLTLSDSESVLEAAEAFTFGRGVDAVVITAATRSNDPVISAGQLCRDRGRVVVVGDVGLELDRSLYYNKELELRLSRSYGPGRYDSAYEEKGQDYPLSYVRWTEQRNLEAFLHLVANGKVSVDPLITHRFPVERGESAYDLIMQGKDPYLGILLEYPSFDQQQMAEQRKRVPVAPATISSTSRRSRASIGLIGCGNFTRDILLPAFHSHSDVHLRGVVSASGISAFSVAKKFGFDYAASEVTQLLEDPDVSTIIIATRHDTHAALVVDAIRAGKSVFVEKPLALTYDEIDAVSQAYEHRVAGGASPILMVGFNRRFAPHIAAVREFFSECEEPLSLYYRVNAGFLPRTHWSQDREKAGGRMLGEGCHFVDLLCYLARSDPQEIFAQALPDQGRYSEDNVMAQIRFANGSIGVLQYVANGDRRSGKERMEIYGGGGSAIVDDFRRAKLSRNGRTRTLGGAWSRQDKGHRGEVDAFLRSVESQVVSPIPFQELVQSSIATLKIVDSLHLGKGLPYVGTDTHSVAAAGFVASRS